MPSVANIVGTDMSAYKIVKRINLLAIECTWAEIRDCLLPFQKVMMILLSHLRMMCLK